MEEEQSSTHEVIEKRIKSWQANRWKQIKCQWPHESSPGNGSRRGGKNKCKNCAQKWQIKIDCLAKDML